jgi:phosphonate transport system substrate-binding protein
MEYLGEKSNRQVVLKQRRTYGEVNALLARGELDLAFLCSAQYVETHDRFGARLLAVPVVDGKTVYRSYIITGRLSDIDSLEGLRGRKFAFVDPLSNTGHLVPTYLLAMQGERPGLFFDSYVFTDSHDNSIRAVSEGLVDGAAVDSMVYDYMAASAPDLLRGTRIIHRSRPFGIPPVVVPSDIDPDLEVDLREWLLSMHEEPNGRAILQQLSIERFVLGDDSDYDDIREMQAFLASRGDDSRDAGAPRE